MTRKTRLSKIKIAIKFVNLRKFFLIIVYANMNFIIKIIKIISIVVDSSVVTIISIVIFDVNLSKNVDIDYNYRDWNYIKTKITLSKIVTSKNNYLNTRFDVILIDKIFWQKQNSNVFVRIKITSLIIRVETENFVIFDTITLFDSFIIRYSILIFTSDSISINLISYVTRLKVLTFYI